MAKFDASPWMVRNFQLRAAQQLEKLTQPSGAIAAGAG